MKSLFRSKNRGDSSPKPNSSRSSSVTSAGDSGIDDDLNRSGSSASTMSNRSNQMTGESRMIPAANEQNSNPFTGTVRSNFHIEHLASFPLSPGDRVVSAKERLQKAKELITKGEPWTKEMELSITDNELVLRDTETQELIERYPLSHIDSVQDINDDPMLKSVLVFSTIQTPEKYAAVHLFQCDKVPASVIAPEINTMMSKPRESPKQNGQAHGVPVLPPPPVEPAPLPPQGVAAFQAAVAAKKETPVPRPSQSPTKIIQGERYGEHSSPDLMEAYINRDVHILNHCIDDIEELVYRVKQVAESWKQLETKYKNKKSKNRRQEAEAIESRSPSREEFIDAFQKCKQSFILLGKLRPHIQNPSAPELVHYLIMPLSLLVRCTRGPEEASKVINPLMTSESIELLRSSLTSKETELWQSLGPAWTLSRSSPHWNNFTMAAYEPKFKSGWVPPEIVGTGRSVPQEISAAVASVASASAVARSSMKKDSREEARTNPTVLSAASKFKDGSETAKSPPSSPSKDSIFKRAKAVYSFNGKNPKELTVNQGDELMILDDSRQWWCVRNSTGGVGFVPSTIFKKSGSIGSSNQSLLSSRSATTVASSPMPVPNGHIRRHDSSSSDNSTPAVFSNHSSSSQEVLISKLNASNGSNEGNNNFQSMIQNRATALKKVDSTDGMQKAKRMSSTDLLNDELKNKISSSIPLSPTSVRPATQESAIILSKGSTPSDVQTWMKSKNFSSEAMNAVKHYSAEELGDMERNVMLNLVGDKEGKKLYTQLTIEKSGECWHQIVVHRGVSELQAVMNRRKNISESDISATVDGSQGIKSAVRAAQSDRQDTWIEKKLTRRPSLENFQDYNDYSESRRRNTGENMTRSTSYELRKKPPVDTPAPPTKPKPKPPPPAPKPRNSSLSSPVAPPPPQYSGALPAPVVTANTSSNQNVDELLREHERQQELLKEQQRQLAELRAQQQQKEQIQHYEQNRVRLEQQVKDQEAMLRLLQQQQQQLPQPQLQSAQIPIHPGVAGIAPQGAYVSYVPYQMPGMPGMPATLQPIPGTQPIYTIPQVYGAIPPPVGYQPK
ncbi:epidermal growth factor receptor kinase substrate 8-like isoform X2 [Dendronephthya gigantea]|uniref:epidermal growth factor receptor kinase substrate 8-like isoform X2 n=1 Tax=Dendronephthya gigantea TaxID=151771 RepID=UPI00106C84BE|nr:epidermal growth factor receptor kinase substrate 8-like isoform X2 [Dendronephthya gigantea]